MKVSCRLRFSVSVNVIGLGIFLVSIYLLLIGFIQPGLVITVFSIPRVAITHRAGGTSLVILYGRATHYTVSHTTSIWQGWWESNPQCARRRFWRPLDLRCPSPLFKPAQIFQGLAFLTKFAWSTEMTLW